MSETNKEVPETNPYESLYDNSWFQFWIVILFGAIQSQFNSVLLMVATYYIFEHKIFICFWLAYGTYIYVDTSPYQGGYSYPLQVRVRKCFIWQSAARYFPIIPHKTSPLPTGTAPYVFGCYPHGMIGLGPSGTFGCDGSDFSSVFPGLRVNLVVLKFPTRLPFARELFLASGCVDASKSSIEWCLRHGRSVALLPGGAKEAMLLCNPMEQNVRILADRKGFIRLAVQNRASVVPVFTFGELEGYTDCSWITNTWAVKAFYDGVKKVTGFTPVIACGPHWWYPFIPHRQQQDVVIGRPIPFDYNGNANSDSGELDGVLTEEEALARQVHRVHEKFLLDLHELYYAHRETYGYGKRELVFQMKDGTIRKYP